MCESNEFDFIENERGLLMSKWLLKAGGLVFIQLAAVLSGTGLAQASNDLDDHWLAAACSQVPVRGRLVGDIRDTDYGVAIGPIPRRTLTLYCNVDADIFHNQIQLVAEDNSPNVQVTASIFQQDLFNPGAPPSLVVSVSTEDQPGLQVAKLFFDPPLEPNEFIYMYFVKIEVVRTNTDPVWVYSVSLQDVL